MALGDPQVARLGERVSGREPGIRPGDDGSRDDGSREHDEQRDRRRPVHERTLAAHRGRVHGSLGACRALPPRTARPCRARERPPCRPLLAPPGANLGLDDIPSCWPMAPPTPPSRPTRPRTGATPSSGAASTPPPSIPARPHLETASCSPATGSRDSPPVGIRRGSCASCPDPRARGCGNGTRNSPASSQSWTAPRGMRS